MELPSRHDFDLTEYRLKPMHHSLLNIFIVLRPVW